MTALSRVTLASAGLFLVSYRIVFVSPWYKSATRKCPWGEVAAKTYESWVTSSSWQIDLEDFANTVARRWRVAAAAQHARSLATVWRKPQTNTVHMLEQLRVGFMKLLENLTVHRVSQILQAHTQRTLESAHRAQTSARPPYPQHCRGHTAIK